MFTFDPARDLGKPVFLNEAVRSSRGVEIPACTTGWVSGWANDWDGSIRSIHAEVFLPDATREYLSLEVGDYEAIWKFDEAGKARALVITLGLLRHWKSLCDETYFAEDVDKVREAVRAIYVDIWRLSASEINFSEDRLFKRIDDDNRQLGQMGGNPTEPPA